MEIIGIQEIFDEQDLKCPITGQYMLEPVTVENGNVYEREAIVEWFKKHETDPMTNAKLNNTNVTMCKITKKLLKKYFELYPEKTEDRYVLKNKEEIVIVKQKKKNTNNHLLL
jgi:hypothetical protein